MAKIRNMVALCLTTVETQFKLSPEFIEKWEDELDTLDCEFSDFLKVGDPKDGGQVSREFVTALCNELGIIGKEKHNITHIESIF